MTAIRGGTFEEDGHLYRDERGKRVLSVTQVFQMIGLVNYDGIQQEVLERKSRLGVAVHKAVEFLTENALDWDTVDDQAMPYVVAAEAWMKQMQFVSIERETQGLHALNGMQYGYQYDHRGRMTFRGRMREVILDLKTCVKESPTWGLQTAAYALAAPRLPAGQRYLRAVLQMKPDGGMKTFYYEDAQDENAFQYMLYCAIWKQNHNFELEKAA